MTVLRGEKGGSVVEWKSTLRAAPGTDVAAARTAIEEIYDTGRESPDQGLVAMTPSVVTAHSAEGRRFPA
jgi:hypothetical protein